MKIFKKILFGLFLLISSAYLFIIISPKIFKDFYPFGIRTAIVLSGSMEPTLEINDFVVVKKPDVIKVNDIVSYRQDDLSKEVLHRIIRMNDDEIVTKGDANNTEDNPIAMSQITGVYVCKIKYLGNIISLMTKPIGISIICTTLVIILLIPTKKED